MLPLDHTGSFSGKELTMDAVATAAPNNSLRQRMLQDMKMLGLVGYKQKGYIRYVRRITSSQSRFSPAGRKALQSFR
jgi:hypothetical protein